MMAGVSAAIDPNLDFASFYEDGGDPDRDCERLYLWHRALWGRTVPGVGPFELEVSYERGYGMRLRSTDGAEFWLGSDRMIPTWSTPGWTYRFAPDLGRVSDVMSQLAIAARAKSSTPPPSLSPYSTPCPFGRLDCTRRERRLAAPSVPQQLSVGGVTQWISLGG